MTTGWVWLGGTAAYMVLAGQVSADEVVAGILLGGVGAAWHAAVRRDGARRFVVEGPAWREIGTSLLKLPRATLTVGVRLAEALVRDVAGRRVEQPFQHGRVADPRDAGRRAVVVLATSLAPDSYVLRLPPNEDVIVFHALTAATPGGDPRWPA